MRRLVAVCAVVAAAATPAAAGVGGTIVTVAEVGHPRGLAVLRDGSFLVAEPYANLVQRVAPDGRVTTVAGTGTAGFSGDGAPATAAELDFVHGVAAMPDGGFVVADTRNERIRRVWSDGTITTVAGTGARAYSGDGGSATAAAINEPRGVAAYPDGRILVPDTGNHRVRLVRLDGSIVTVAGTGVRGDSGDGGPAVAAELDEPFAVAPLPDGGFLIDDAGTSRVRRVWPDGRITAVAGAGEAGYSGDGEPAVRARLSSPQGLAVTRGLVLIADTANNRIRLVRADGTISTIAGTGDAGYSGDGGASRAARLDQPKAVAVAADGSILVGDSANDRVRVLRRVLPPQRLTLQLTRRWIQGRRGSRTEVRYRLGRAATVRARVLRGLAVLSAAGARGRAGANTIHVRVPRRRGRYRLVLDALAPDGASATASALLVVSP
jgi:NHL repeat